MTTVEKKIRKKSPVAIVSHKHRGYGSTGNNCLPGYFQNKKAIDMIASVSNQC